MPSQSSSTLAFPNPAAPPRSSSFSLARSCTAWEHNTRKLGCFCLNLSWTSFSNLSELLICRAGASVLPSNQRCCLTCCFHSCTLFPPCIILPALPPSLHQTAFLVLPSSPLSSLLAVQTINSHHPSASDNGIDHKQIWFSMHSITDFAASHFFLILHLVKNRDL